MCSNRAKSLITVKVRNGVGDPRVVRAVEFTEAKCNVFKVISAPLKGQLTPSRIYSIMIDGDLQTTACSLLLVKAGAGRVSRVSLLMLLLPRDTIKVSRSTYFYDMQLYMCKFDDTYILSSFTEKSGCRENSLGIVDPIIANLYCIK